MGAEATVRRRRFSGLGDVARTFAAVFADPKTKFGIKLGLAGMLTLFISQLIRLEHAVWALFTVIVLAQGQYVGAIAQRSMARVVGTVIGGFVGAWLVGNHEQNGLFFLMFAFVYISFCNVREEFRKTAEALAKVFREGSTRGVVPSTETARVSFRSMLEEVRRRDLLADQSLETVVSFLSLSHRLDIIADSLESCRKEVLALRIADYWGDYLL